MQKQASDHSLARLKTWEALDLAASRIPLIRTRQVPYFFRPRITSTAPASSASALAPEAGSISGAGGPTANAAH
jgi:hypothetical protein